MERTAYLHVGPHKTGSTSLQAFLAANRAALADRSLLVPAATGARGRALRHERLFRWILRPAPSAPERADLESVFFDWDGDIVLSDELVSHRISQARHWTRIRDFFAKAGFRVVVVAVVREAVGHANSFYVQDVKRLRRNCEPEAFLAYYRRTRGLDTVLRHVLRDDGVTLRLIDLGAAGRQGLERTFLRAVDRSWSDDLALPDGPLNPNPGKVTIAVCRHLMDRAGGPLVGTADHVRIYRLVKAAYMENRWFEEPYFGFDEDAQRRLFDACSGYHHDLLARYGVDGAPRERPRFVPRPVETTEWRSLSRADRQAADALISAVGRIIPLRPEPGLLRRLRAMVPARFALTATSEAGTGRGSGAARRGAPSRG